MACIGGNAEYFRTVVANGADKQHTFRDRDIGGTRAWSRLSVKLGMRVAEQVAVKAVVAQRHIDEVDAKAVEELDSGNKVVFLYDCFVARIFADSKEKVGFGRGADIEARLECRHR